MSAADRNTSRPTIVAAATPAGSGGVAIVRLSGERANAIGAEIAGPLPPPRQAAERCFRDREGQAIDLGLVLRFEGPASFTGEDVVELHCHGGPVIVAGLQATAIDLGARRARPGEFSERAFLNGKLDLAQAEAIADLITSGTEQAARAALRSLSGAFSEAIAVLERQLVELRVYVEAAIDFPDEDEDFLTDETLAQRLRECRGSYASLLESAGRGRLLRDGFQIVIAGRPNAGKSSLLNHLSGEDTAMVTDIAGTTRDVLRERIDVDGLAVELVDTAGLRDDPDVIEAEGIRRARRAIEQADAALWIEDSTTFDRYRPSAELPEGLPVLVVRNKIDLVGETAGRRDGIVFLSARTGEGIDALKSAIRALAGYRQPGEGTFTARRRHIEALELSQRHFEAGCRLLEEQQAGELLAEELRLALDALGEVTGKVTSDELLGKIFSSFCIGK